MPINLCNSEYEEIKGIYKQRQISAEKLLEEKVMPLQKRVSRFSGELIAVLTRDYEQISTCTPASYGIKEEVYIGIITPQTRFPAVEWLRDPYNINFCGVILSGVENPHSLELDSGFEREFRKEEKGEFHSWSLSDTVTLLYFMERPPQAPATPKESGCFGGIDHLLIETQEPRLELYIGSGEAVPFLQEKLRGWEYLQLAETLEQALPIPEELERRIEKEQLDLYDKLKKEEQKARALTERRERRLNSLTNGEGIFYYEGGIELTDEVVEWNRYSPSIEESKRRIRGLVNTAVNRGYHETGRQIRRVLDVGVVKNINIKEFFSHRKEMYDNSLK
ncbi:hypothetical protein J4463_01505 [Candidatus Pacearchaeota archaeon]|nr:hypothetical protein [Candidatus Pacearchaeota archaeon]